MSDISDKLIDETFKGVIPYITPWRVILTATGLLLISNNLSSFDFQNLLTLSLLQISKQLISASTEIPVWKLGLIVITTFFAIPKSSNSLLFLVIKRIHIPKCKPALTELAKLKTHKPTKLASIFASKISELYETRRLAIKKIQKLRLIFEVMFGACFFSIVTAIKTDHSGLILVVLVTTLILLFILSKKVTLLYLTKVAPSSIIFESLRTMGTFRRSKSSF